MMNLEWSIMQFRRGLTGAMSWLERRSQESTIQLTYRSPELAPHRDIVEDLPLSEIERTVRNVVDRRHKLLTAGGKTIKDWDSVLGHGRLIAFYPQQTLFDGAAALETDGLIDANNVPPWDLWACFVDDFLVSFIPDALVASFNCAVIVNPEQSLLWLTDVSHPFVNILEENQLLA